MTSQLHAETDRIDRLFNCLGHPRRRRLLGVIAAESTPIPVETVIEEIATYESEAGSGATVVDLSDEISIALIHSHLPKLRDAGIIALDGESDMVMEGDRFEMAVRLIEAV